MSMDKRYGLLMGVWACCFILTACAGKESRSGGEGTSASETPTTTETKGTSAKGGVPDVSDPEGKKGRIVFVREGCTTCHFNPSVGKDYPDLRGLYGKKVKLKNGTEVIADEDYIRRSIRFPAKEVVAGYEPTMPNYAHLSEEQVGQLVAYIRAMKDLEPQFLKEGERE